MNTKTKQRLISIVLCVAMLISLMPTSVFAAGGTEFVHFAIKEHWGVYFEQTGSNNLYPITLTNENKLSVPLPTLYRTDYDGYIFDGWYIADTDTKVTQDTVFDGYTVVVDRWTFQEKDYNTVISSIKVNNVALEAGMTTAEYNAAVQGATATVNGAPADAITADSAKNYTIYHGLNKSGDPLGVDEEVEVGQDYSVVTKIKLADGYTFSPNITFVSDAGMCASERFLGGADLYTKEWNTLANAVEVTINFMNTDYYFAQTPESRYLENYAQYINWYKVSKVDGLESVTLQYEVDGQWAIFIDNIPFEAVGSEAGGYVTVSPYVDTTKTFRLVANYTHGKVYSEPFEVSWACLTPVIESIGIGLTAPQNGYSPEYTITTDTNRCALKSENSETVKNGIKWTGDVVGELTVSGSKFNNDNDYTVSIKLVAQDGYTFANNVTATINANNANVSIESETEIRVSYTFSKPEKAKWYVSFNNAGGYASGTMQSVQVEEGEYTLPEHTYTPNTGYVFEGWLVGGLLKQPGDVITVTENIILNAKWKDTNDYDAPHGFTKQPADASNIVGMQIQYSVDNFTVDPSVTYENVIAQIYDSESGEWTTATTEVSAGNGIVENYGQQFIIFSSDAVGEFTFRLYATQGSTKVAISENFTVTWTPKQFTTQPQGDMVVVGETVTVTAEKNFYAEKYEIEYNDGGVWKLYQEVAGSGWGAFSLNFTSNEAKSVTFRINAYAEGDVYDEENDCFPIVLIDTSEEFTITWTSNEHIHVYGAIPNGIDETNHWKECTDAACPDKAHSKIEPEVHKDNTADYKCDVCGYDMPVPTYTVTFDSNGGSDVAAQSIEEGQKAAKPADPTKAGYDFKGWTLNGSAYDFNTAVTGDITLVAVWEAQQIAPTMYTVTFDSNGGSDVAAQSIEEGQKAAKPADPTKAGYDFKGWTLNGAAYDFNTAVIGDITLVAAWEAQQVAPTMYTVTFDSNGGSDVAAQSIEEGQKAAKPADPTKAGYDFKGWTLNGSAYDFNSAVNGDITLVAVWEAQQVAPTMYTVTFDSNGGSDVAAQSIEEGQKAAKPADPTKAGYDFKGWTLNGSAYDFNSAVNGDITLVATWEQQQVQPTVYTVTFDSNGGSAVTAQNIEEGQKATKPADPTKSGYDFKGWTLNGAAYDFNTAVNGNITLIATWEAQQVVPATYTVSFDANGGTGTMADVTGVSGEYTLPANGFTAPSGQQFKAWNVGGSEYAAGAAINVAADTTVKAVWKTVYTGGGYGVSASYGVTVLDCVGADVKVSDKYAYAGEKITITIVPEQGKRVDTVAVTDKNGKAVEVSCTADGTYTFKMPKSKVTVQVQTVDIIRIEMVIDNPCILFNGEPFVNDVPPVLIHDRTMVPVSVITAMLGGTSEWDGTTRQVTLHLDGQTFVMTIDQVIAGFDVAPIILNSRTYVPVGYIMGVLGADVQWIGDTREVIIQK